MMNDRKWLKSSRSQNGATCVEVAGTLDEIRDSKDPHGPTLRLNRASVAVFVRAAKQGRFDR